MPPSTTETITVIPTAVSNVFRSVKSLPNMATITVIFIIDDILKPSISRGAPNGISTFLICAGILIFSAPYRLAGIVALLLHVPNAVNDGVILFSQNIFSPFFPPAIHAYKLKNTTK